MSAPNASPTFYCQGFQFERQDYGFVVIRQGGGLGPAATFSRADMASIFAFLSPAGDTAENFAKAKEFLGGEPPPPPGAPDVF